MYKYRLFTPGPTPIPESVLSCMAKPILHHRTSKFSKLFEKVRENLRFVFQTKEEVLCIAGTGTAAMEGCVSNFLNKNDKALYINAGKFGERWGKILRAYGCDAIEIKIPWGQSVDPKQVSDILKKHDDIKAVYIQASETSTGISHPVKEVAFLCKERPQTICVVDGITAIGVSDIAMDRDHIDVLISASQKAFMLPPGLAFIGVSQKAWQFSKNSLLPKFYLDFNSEFKAAQKNQSAYTSSVSLILGLSESLRLMKEEGLEEIFQRHQRIAYATRSAIKAMNLEIFAKTPSNGLTSVLVPNQLDANRIIQLLNEKYNITIAGGQDAIKGKVFRVAHMGYFDDLDMISLIGALEKTLLSLGVKFESGVGTATFLKNLL